MCGVFAAVDAWPGMADRALRLLAHRGPNAAACLHVGRNVLAHTRLAIQDLDHRSDQPYVVPGAAVSYNGELWNAPAVRAELQARGRAFRNTYGNVDA